MRFTMMLCAATSAFAMTVRTADTLDAGAVDDVDLFDKLRSLAKIASDLEETPHHLVSHAKSMSLLTSLDELHAHPDHHRLSMDVVMAATDSMSTDELEIKKLWLTQCQIDRTLNQPCHEDDKIPSGNTKEMELLGLDLQYADIDAGPSKWASSPVNHDIPYCFLKKGKYALEGDAINVMRAAFKQVQQEINTMGDCLFFHETFDCECPESSSENECNKSVKRITVGKFDDAKCWAASPYKGRSRINLGWCDWSAHKGAMIHEIGHAIGLGHEQMRTDRDRYIQVNWDKIDSSWRSQYYKYNSKYSFYHVYNDETDGWTADKHRPYNYNSIMHYESGYNNKMTTPCDKTCIGRRTGGFDGNDVSQIREIFQCTPAFADSLDRGLDAVPIASGKACSGGMDLVGSTPQDCVQNMRNSVNRDACSVVQFETATLSCKCCDSPITATASPGTDLYMVHLGTLPAPAPGPGPAGLCPSSGWTAIPKSDIASECTDTQYCRNLADNQFCCKAPNYYHGPCGKCSNLNGYTTTRKDEWKLMCEVP